ncbi:MAG: hypothetical protein QOI75_1355, partial [Pseudonocardiales bacterium]|nr:hypothetical protein [Pseudonocardiales bacterium]
GYRVHVARVARTDRVWLAQTLHGLCELLQVCAGQVLARAAPCCRRTVRHARPTPVDRRVSGGRVRTARIMAGGARLKILVTPVRYSPPRPDWSYLQRELGAFTCAASRARALSPAPARNSRCMSRRPVPAAATPRGDRLRGAGSRPLYVPGPTAQTTPRPHRLWSVCAACTPSVRAGKTASRAAGAGGVGASRWPVGRRARRPGRRRRRAGGRRSAARSAGRPR